jgi:FG-GAP-like repeat
VAGVGNADGTNARADILVGANLCDTNSRTANGKAFLIRSNAGAPLLSLGVVAGVGDVSGDGVADFAVGAPLEENGATVDAGRVRVFRGNATGVPSSIQAISMSTAFSGACGSAIIGNIDFNRDGRKDIAVGEPTNANGAAGGGRVRVFFGNATGLIDEIPEVTINGTFIDGKFGSVLGAGDLKSDTYGDLAIVERGYANGQPTEGRVFVRSGEW